MGEEQIRVVDNPAELRYELWVDAVLAGFIAYRREPGALVLVHTDIDPAHEGKGFVRTAGEVTLSRGRQTARFRVAEAGPEEAIPVLRKYIAEIKVTRA